VIEDAGRVRVERVSPATEGRALAYLARSPYENVFITYLLRSDFSAPTRERIFVAIDDSGVTGAAYFGRQVSLAGEPAAIAAFAAEAHRHRGERMLMGPREAIEAYWARVHLWHVPPRAVRERQLVMAVDRKRLRRNERAVTVRPARLDEWTAVADNSAAMIAGELDYDPHRFSPDFGPNVRHMIEQRLWWVGESLGRLVFFCNIGPWCEQTTQLQGIWSPPEMRGKGLATAALAAICDRLLEDSPTLSLYVNDFNAPAIALYERVGFETASEYRTMLF